MGEFISQADDPPDPLNDFRKAFAPLIEGTEITSAAQANEAHHRITGLFLDALGLGKFLVEQKEKVGHANWEQWVKNELEFTSRTASRYMLLYNERSQFATEQIRHALSDLSMRKALKILSGNKKRAKAATKKKSTENVPGQQPEDSNRPYLSRTSYKQFADAVALLKGLDQKDYRYPQWIEILEGVLADMKSEVSAPQSEFGDANDGSFLWAELLADPSVFSVTPLTARLATARTAS
jgi:hypothetical protein